MGYFVRFSKIKNRQNNRQKNLVFIVQLYASIRVLIRELSALKLIFEL